MDCFDLSRISLVFGIKCFWEGNRQMLRTGKSDEEVMDQKITKYKWEWHIKQSNKVFKRKSKLREDHVEPFCEWIDLMKALHLDNLKRVSTFQRIV